LYPITFSIPECKIINELPKKTQILSKLIPGKLETYIYDNEKDYYDQYKKSYFAITTKKAGWDCLRHYEIISNGCIPYFIYFDKCPKNTLFLFPKELILKGNELYLKYSETLDSFLDSNYIQECDDLIIELLKFQNIF
jgi:hypothetical protein